MTNSTGNQPTNPAQIYAQAGLICLRAPAKYETKTNVQNKIKACPFPTHATHTNQLNYGPHSGDWYSLRMGWEFKPGRFAILLDFDKKAEGPVKSGVDLAKMLNMDQYGAPSN